MLNMPRHDEAWHQQDLTDELAEYNEATGPIDRWSELSDVVYTYTRAHWSGHPSIAFPFSRARFFVGTFYMIPKYTLRWGFFRTLGRQFDAKLRISEVRNPKKIEKLEKIADKYNLDKNQFVTKAEQLMKYWPFLK